MSSPTPSVAEYRCPGENFSISRAVHWGRMARFYPGCRLCPHRDDTGRLSARQTQQLVEVRARAAIPPLFHEEGAGGPLNTLGPGIARDLAAALGAWLQRSPGLLGQSGGPPVVVVGGDGQPVAAPHIAAVGEALRWTGCHVVDLGPAGAACLMTAIERLPADGGILVSVKKESGGLSQFGHHASRGRDENGTVPFGRESGGQVKKWGPAPNAVRCLSPFFHPGVSVGVKFWTRAEGPLSRGGTLEQLRSIYETGVDRPTRTYGPLRRFQAATAYLADLASGYHALRPLRFVLDSTCTPWTGYLRELTRPVACRILLCRPPRDRLGSQVVEEKAHFGLHIEDDGEICRLLDERGTAVPPERLLTLLTAASGDTSSDAPIVLEEDIPPGIARQIESLGRRVILSSPLREAMARTMRRHGALLGGGPSGRLWHADGGLPLPDALRTVTRLLTLLSRSDRPLSEILDR